MKMQPMTKLWKYCSLLTWLALTCLMAIVTVDAAQVTITYTYDTAGRLTGASYSSGKAIAYTYDANGNVTQRVTTIPVPEIHVKQGSTDLPSGGSYSFGSVNVGSSSAAITFTIQNLGDATLTLSGITKGGSHPTDFTVTQPASPVAAGGSTTFTVKFTPGATGARSATITIANNDSDESSYLINLSGTGATAPTGNSYLLWTK
ncbi:CHU large protein/ candidate b-glycosidase, glycoside hydrolase family 8 protein [Candidatus Vecturithrix granuli]|uniref:CHU large protein/ candidate b-glycosidase, glycoside hydrolase family 8 protein n=1 Tax=Vecturithrix granuli TaxID=1499967 RepID=A0A0S6WA28_VECG1|nr:CHU large protein/ candidate b-glycosidase, glycoside hydrolase family 8 protein [Candidatus Vecturithrix granuli]